VGKPELNRFRQIGRDSSTGLYRRVSLCLIAEPNLGKFSSWDTVRYPDLGLPIFKAPVRWPNKEIIEMVNGGVVYKLIELVFGFCRVLRGSRMFLRL
jgi:hypothetical protein